MCVCQEAIERKEKRARRFHFCGEETGRQRNVFLDKDMMKKGDGQLLDLSQDLVCTGDVLVYLSSSSSVVLSHPQAPPGSDPRDRSRRHEHTGRLWVF